MASRFEQKLPGNLPLRHPKERSRLPRQGVHVKKISRLGRNWPSLESADLSPSGKPMSSRAPPLILAQFHVLATMRRKILHLRKLSRPSPNRRNRLGPTTRTRLQPMTGLPPSWPIRLFLDRTPRQSKRETIADPRRATSTLFLEPGFEFFPFA